MPIVTNSISRLRAQRIAVRCAGLATLALAAQTLVSSPALALDSRILGAWATSQAECAATFVRSGQGWRFKQPADQFKPSFIITEKAIVAPGGDCQILQTTQKGGAIQLKLQCRSSVSYVDQTETVRILESGKMSRGFGTDEAMSTTYEKCGS